MRRDILKLFITFTTRANPQILEQYTSAILPQLMQEFILSPEDQREAECIILTADMIPKLSQQQQLSILPAILGDFF